jgi:hypothetical protein
MRMLQRGNYGASDTIPVVLDGDEIGALAVQDLLL